MRFNVAQLLKEPVGSNRSYHLDESMGADNINSVKGEVTLTRTKNGIIVSGAVTATVTEACNRCLKPIDYQLDYDFEEEAFSSTDLASGSNVPNEPDSLTIDDNHEVDLSEMIRQYTLLTMPTKPLCRSDCAGICQSCGHDLNKGRCQCSPQPSDHRWSKLICLGKENKV